MAQKDKVKELVGRGLHSYHTKSLQQIDRIEKKNKEQNHKISILSNELDNDYLTKTEEGSVISLEHSKEGMVYLDELQGNTLVNYCTDGSKELTLNGDIDVEGTFVTITEGVDNGKVDVMCEGNTLVNLYENKSKLFHQNYIYNGNERVDLSRFVKGKEYTAIILNSTSNYQSFRISTGNIQYDLVPPTIGTIKKFTYIPPTDSNIDKNDIRCYCYPNSNKFSEGDENKIKTLILEGDWTNKEIPSYFEGMKSVGQDDINGHKIEILSENKNLFNPIFWDNVFTINNSPTSNGYNGYIIKAKPNTDYFVSCTQGNADFTSGSTYAYIVTNNGQGHQWIVNQNSNIFGNTSFKITTGDDGYMILRVVIYGVLSELKKLSIQIEEGCVSTSYAPYSLNKKEILLNEPLRGLPNGIKDKFVKQGGKWYVKRNCGEVIIDESYFNSHSWGSDSSKNYVYIMNALPNLKNGSYIFTDKIPYSKSYTNVSCFSVSSTSVIIFCFPQNIETIEQRKELVRPYLQNGGLKVVYQLNSPTYEEITDVELITYLDTTHISNNSTIPCNMKIKNRGYNAIIKPSTLYTVALDTNKSGTVGINLGGAKGTTTNNVVTVTTPATLTDDSLRLYGKGIKGSKVRLLEGDKTNWIPSYFEGMKSSFEDKLQDDGTYKMEILMNNENLFDSTKIPDYTGGDMRYYNGYGGLFKRIENKEYILGNYGGMAFVLNLPKNKTYKISIKVRNSNGSNTKVQSTIFLNKEMIGHTKSTFTTNVTENVIGFGVVNYNEDTDLILYDVILSEVIDEYTERKSNKIQFSSIEPLRGLPSGVKDRFLFKDNKLMIERNTKKIFLNNQTISSMITYDIAHNGTMLPFSFKLKNSDCKKGAYIEVPCNKFATSSNSYRGFPINCIQQYIDPSACFVGSIHITNLKSKSSSAILEYFNDNNIEVTYQLAEPTYEEIPFELQKIILEGYENGTLFFDTNIPPTSTVTYAGETPIVKSVRLNKTEVLNNTDDINDNIIPYLMDMDYRVVCLQLQSEGFNDGVSMARLFGGTYEMLQRDIQSKRYSIDEYKHRLDAYLDANKITEEEYNKLGDMLNE